MENLAQNEQYFEPDKQGKYARTNEFLKRAAESMNLPRYEGERAARLILRRVKQYLSEDEGFDFIQQLPTGLKEECRNVESKRRKENVSAKGIKEDLSNICSRVEGADPSAVAKSFWAFLTEWTGNDPFFNKGEGGHVMVQLPEDIEKLLRSDF